MKFGSDWPGRPRPLWTSTTSVRRDERLEVDEDEASPSRPEQPVTDNRDEIVGQVHDVHQFVGHETQASPVARNEDQLTHTTEESRISMQNASGDKRRRKACEMAAALLRGLLLDVRYGLSDSFSLVNSTPLNSR